VLNMEQWFPWNKNIVMVITTYRLFWVVTLEYEWLLLTLFNLSLIHPLGFLTLSYIFICEPRLWILQTNSSHIRMDVDNLHLLFLGLKSAKEANLACCRSMNWYQPHLYCLSTKDCAFYNLIINNINWKATSHFIVRLVVKKNFKEWLISLKT